LETITPNAREATAVGAIVGLEMFSQSRGFHRPEFADVGIGLAPFLAIVSRPRHASASTYRDHQSGIGRACNMEKPSSDRHCRRQNQDNPP
jgi:hypothetical protein